MRAMGFAFALFAPVGAWAADYTIAPPPAWIQTVAPNAAARTDGAIDLRLIDVQTRLDAGGLHQYLHQVVRVVQPQALQAIGTFGAIWQPATDTIRFHRVVIHRGDQDIDVLKDGSALQVIRREAGLEAAFIDGKLTATMPVPDLRVGDEIEFAYTIDTHNPVLGTHRESDQLINRSAQIDRLYLRNTWPEASKLRWRIGSGLPKPAVSRSADGDTVLTIDRANFLAPDVPAQSPGRFIDANRLQVTDFADWQALSALFAPIFDAAATPAADSPVTAEIGRIAAAAADPKARAAAALQLVQSQVRYLARMDGLGGYQPASADAVWKERLGDCKGKTVLLLALLRGLGIDAQAAIVSVQQSDGVDASLPLAGRFDHVIVRATIGGKAYWLDGTRMGDSDLDQIAVPGFQWALPLTRPGSALVRLIATEPALPTEEMTLDLDARGGITVPAKATGIGILRGDGASSFRTSMSFLSETQRTEVLRKLWTQRHDWVEVKDVTYAVDDKSGEVRIGFTGTGKMDWNTEGADAERHYQANKAYLGETLTPDRLTDDPDVPVKVDERYTVTHQTILLPDNGKGFTIEGDPIDRTVAGLHYVRTAALHDGRFEMTASTRSKAGEITLAEAKAADKQATEIFNQNLYVRLPEAKPAGGRPAGKEGAPMVARDAKLDQFAALLARRDWAGTVKAADAVLATDSENIDAMAYKGIGLAGLGKADEADILLDAALARDGRNLAALRGKAALLEGRKRYDDTLILLDRMILIEPGDGSVYYARGLDRWAAGHRDAAVADMLLAAQKMPDQPAVIGPTINMLASLGRNDEALPIAADLVRLMPGDADAHRIYGDLLARVGRKDQARAELQRSLAIKPGAAADYALLDYDLTIDDKAKLDLVVRLIGEDSAYELPAHALESLARDPAAYAGMVAAFDRLEKTHPGISESSQSRNEIDMVFGHAEKAVARLDQAAAHHSGDASVLNSVCWFRATHRIDLGKALAVCNAAIAIEAAPAALDSRGMVHLQRSEWAAAIADYDAALAKSSDLAQSLFGRGVAKRRMGDIKGGNADLDAARRLDPRIDAANADYGLTP